MVTKFKIFENVDQLDNYIVSFPSGEVVFYKNENEVFYLLDKKYIYLDRNARGHKYSCSDFLLSKVKDHLERIRSNDIRVKVKEFLKRIGLEYDHYKFNNDDSIDVYTAVNMSNLRLTKIPVKFNKCYSDFDCSHNQLTSLLNCPVEIHGNFNCSYNRLKNLLFGPKIIFKSGNKPGVYNCSYNELQTLQGSPLRVHDFNCSHNYLLDLEKLPIVTGKLDTSKNLL